MVSELLKQWNKAGFMSANKTILKSPTLFKLWNFEKNGKLNPENFTCGSNKKVWWKCFFDHEWESDVYHVFRSNKNGNSGCPYCTNKKICFDNCLATLNPELAKQWHPTKNVKLTPFDVGAGSCKNVWWKCCFSDDHEWQARVVDVFKSKKTGCPFCANKKVCFDNCLATLNPELAKQWHPTKNVKLTPFDVTAGSHKKVWWIDKYGHEWQSTVRNRSGNNSGCPICFESKGEKQVAIILEKLNIKFERQFKFDDCKDKQKLSFDFCVWKNDVPYLIEYQGEQHYRPVDFGSKKISKHIMFKVVQKRDKIKRETCKDNSYPLLEIPYWEFENMENLIKKYMDD